MSAKERKPWDSIVGTPNKSASKALSGWDHHGDIRKNLPARFQGIDKPIAALVVD